MVQKKNETFTAEEVVESIPMASFVTTFWNQLEKSSEYARKLREDREDAYFNAVREVIQFNKQYRQSLVNLYEQAKKTNKDMLSEVMSQINSITVKEVVPSEDREELNNQLKAVTDQMEQLAYTPVKSLLHAIDQLEDNFEQNTESGIAYTREQRNAWVQVRNEYVKNARNTHLDLVERGKNSFKELVKTR